MRKTTTHLYNTLLQRFQNGPAPPPIRRNMFLLVARKTTGADSMERIESTIGRVNNNVKAASVL